MSERGGYVPPEASQNKTEDDEDAFKSGERKINTPYGLISGERRARSPETGHSGDVQIHQFSSPTDDTSSQNDSNGTNGTGGQSDDATDTTPVKQEAQGQQEQQNQREQQEQGDERDYLSHRSPEDREKYDESLANTRRFAGQQAVNHTLRPGE